MDQPARRTTDADATSTNQSNVTHIFCGKLNVVQPATLAQPRNRQKAVEQRGFPANPQSSHLPAWRSCRGRKYAGAAPESRFSSSGAAEYPKNERPVRGDNRTGQAIWARLGWMGARAEYSLDGEG